MALTLQIQGVLILNRTTPVALGAEDKRRGLYQVAELS